MQKLPNLLLIFPQYVQDVFNLRKRFEASVSSAYITLRKQRNINLQPLYFSKESFYLQRYLLNLLLFIDSVEPF